MAQKKQLMLGRDEGGNFRHDCLLIAFSFDSATELGSQLVHKITESSRLFAGCRRLEIRERLYGLPG